MSSAPFTTRLIVTLIFMVLLAVASVIPGRAQPGDSLFVWLAAKTPTLLQKSLHVFMYGVLTLMWFWTLDAVNSRGQRLAVALAVAVCFGAVLEWYQTKVPGRFGTLFDMVLNAAGALLGAIVAVIML